jgi:GNAT superfamily N-acetyltransferase
VKPRSGAKTPTAELARPLALKRLSRPEMDQVAVIFRKFLDARRPWLAGLFAPEEDRAYFRDQVFPKCRIWAAMDGPVVGFIAFREGWIDQLYVLPPWQRRGAGRALLQIAMRSFPRLQLRTFQSNGPARAFYEAHGFVAIRKTDGSDNEEREPEILYEWKRETRVIARPTVSRRRGPTCTKPGR